jgi:hypothetical protein
MTLRIQSPGLIHQASDLGAERIVRALVRAYDASSHLAELELCTGPRALLSGVPVLTSIPPRQLVNGREVALLLWPDVGGLVLGPWSPAPDRLLQGWAVDTSTRTFTQQSYTAYTNLQLSFTLEEESYFWVWALVNGYASAARATSYAAAIFVDGAQLNPPAIQGAPSANLWQPSSLALRSATSYAPGSHTVDLRIYVYTAGDTITLRYAGLGAIATQKG